MKNEEFNKSLDGIYQFMAEAYGGNWQYRWGGTPYMQTAKAAGKVESVAAHVWACMGFWFHLRRICPQLASLVDPLEIYEIIWSHDLGETHVGDTPLYLWAEGKAEKNSQIERQVVEKMSKSLAPDTKKRLIEWIDGFEEDPSKITKLETLIARLIDALQGNHFAFVHGNDLVKYGEPIRKIVQKNTGRYVKRLIEVLEEKRAHEAIEEAKQVIRHHATLIRTSGLNLDDNDFGL